MTVEIAESWYILGWILSRDLLIREIIIVDES